jgi:hypothetical protein
MMFRNLLAATAFATILPAVAAPRYGNAKGPSYAEKQRQKQQQQAQLASGYDPKCIVVKAKYGNTKGPSYHDAACDGDRARFLKELRQKKDAGKPRKQEVGK